jgi:hypothetical protein
VLSQGDNCPDTVFNISIATITEMAKDMRDLQENPEEPPLPLVDPPAALAG